MLIFLILQTPHVLDVGKGTAQLSSIWEEQSTSFLLLGHKKIQKEI